MLVLFLRRWPFQPAKMDDNELPTAPSVVVEEDVGAPPGLPVVGWPAVPRPWWDGDEGAGLPSNTIEDSEEWFLRQVLAQDNTRWVPQETEEYPLQPMSFGLDDEPWLLGVSCPQGFQRWLPWDADEVPTTPTALDDESLWPQRLAWPHNWQGGSLFVPDDLGDVGATIVDDSADTWRWWAPWPEDARGLRWQVADEYPATLGLDDEPWLLGVPCPQEGRRWVPWEPDEYPTPLVPIGVDENDTWWGRPFIQWPPGRSLLGSTLLLSLDADGLETIIPAHTRILFSRVRATQPQLINVQESPPDAGNCDL